MMNMNMMKDMELEKVAGGIVIPMNQPIADGADSTKAAGEAVSAASQGSGVGAIRGSGVGPFRSSGVGPFRSSGVGPFRSSGVGPFRSSGVGPFR